MLTVIYCEEAVLCDHLIEITLLHIYLSVQICKLIIPEIIRVILLLEHSDYLVFHRIATCILDISKSRVDGKHLSND